MDEKLAVSRNALNRAFEKQLDKRTSAPPPTPENAQTYLADVNTASAATAAGFDFEDFFEAWDKYYGTIVKLLGFASWFLPGKAVAVIKALLAVVNNDIIPIIRELTKK